VIAITINRDVCNRHNISLRTSVSRLETQSVSIPLLSGPGCGNSYAGRSITGGILCVRKDQVDESTGDN